MAGLFQKAFKGLNQSIKAATSSALNKALSSSRAKITKVLRDETGLKNAQIYQRIREVKANKNSLSVKLAIATKVGISLAEFKPSVKKVNVVHKGNKNATTHYGVTVKIGSATRTLVPGAWLATASNGKQLVLVRKDDARYPTVALRSTLFNDIASREQAPTQAYLRDTFNNLIADQIDFEISKRFSANRS